MRLLVIVVTLFAVASTAACTGADEKDRDEDGYTPAQGDCNDEVSSIHPGASEQMGDAVDQDCDGHTMTASFLMVEDFGNLQLRGPKLDERASDVVLAVLGESVEEAPPFVKWHSIDPASGFVSPLSRTVEMDGIQVGEAFDMEARERYLSVGFTAMYDDWVGVSFLQAWEDGRWSYRGWGYSPTYIQDFHDIDLHDDGEVVSIIGCTTNSSSDPAIYLRGTPEDFYGREHEIAMTPPMKGEESCAVRGTSAVMVSADGSGVTEYEFDGTETLGRVDLWSGGSYSDAEAEADWWVVAGSSGLEFLDGVNDVVYNTEEEAGIVAASQDSNGTWYVVYSNLEGTHTRLVHGSLDNLQETPLDVGLNRIEGLDVLVTSTGELIVAAQGNGILKMMSVGP